MTEEEKKEYRENLTQQCKKYCHIDYDDDIDIVELMINTTLEEMQELIPNFDVYKMTNRQRLIALVSVKNLYDNRATSTEDLPIRPRMYLKKELQH